MANGSYVNEAQQRMLQVIEHLAGNELDGISAAEIARKMEKSSTAIFRDLKNLEAAGWAQKLDGAGWSLTPYAAKIMRKIADTINRTMSRVNQLHKEFFQGE